MTPEDQAYVDEHDLDRLIQAMMMAMLRSKPKDPMSFLIQKLSKQLKRREARSAAGSSNTTATGHRRRSLLKKRPTGLTLDNDDDEEDNHDAEDATFATQRSRQHTPVNTSRAMPPMSLSEVLEEEEAPPVSSRGIQEAQPSSTSSTHGRTGADDAEEAGPAIPAQQRKRGFPEGQQQGQEQEPQGGRSRSIASQALALLDEGDSETDSSLGAIAMDDEEQGESNGSCSDASDDDGADNADPLNSSQYQGVHGHRSRRQPRSIIHCPSCGTTINNTTDTPTVVAPKQGTASSLWTSAGHAFRFTQALRRSAAQRRGGGGHGVGQATAHFGRRLATLRLNEGEEDELGDGDLAAGSHGSPRLGALLTTRRRRERGEGAGRSYHDPRKGRLPMASDEDTANEEDNDDFVEDSVFGGAEFDNTVKASSRRKLSLSVPQSARGSRPGSQSRRRGGKHSDLVSTWRSGSKTPTNMLRSLGSVGPGDADEEDDMEDVMSVATGVDADDELEAFFRSHPAP